MKNDPFVLSLILFLSGFFSLDGQTVRFAGKEWKIRQTSEGKPPGNNNRSGKNVWVDSLDRLHLKISYSKDDDKWSCAEILSTDSLSFGFISGGCGTAKQSG